MTTSAPTASVIVPARDAESTLVQCIESLLALDYPRERLELVVVDNGSTDATPAILAGYAGRLRVVTEPTPGRSAARNTGLAAAAGEIVAFTDADCVVDEHWLRALVVPLGARNNLVVGGTILAQGASGNERFGERIHDHRMAIERELPPYVITMNCASRLDTLRRHAAFDESVERCEDVDLSWRLYRAGCVFRYAPDAVVRHRNERTLGGLFVEGARHGFHGMNVQRRHRPMLRAFGHPIGWRAATRHGAVALRAVGAPDRSPPDLAFRWGKAVGAAAGSVRFRGDAP